MTRFGMLATSHAAATVLHRPSPEREMPPYAHNNTVASCLRGNSDAYLNRLLLGPTRIILIRMRFPALLLLAFCCLFLP
jgi:hypothetical protein